MTGNSSLLGRDSVTLLYAFGSFKPNNHIHNVFALTNIIWRQCGQSCLYSSVNSRFHSPGYLLSGASDRCFLFFVEETIMKNTSLQQIKKNVQAASSEFTLFVVVPSQTSE